MSKHFQSIRGMNDLLPADLSVWQQVESRLQQIIKRYGYQEIRMPILEATEVFSRSIGEVTDIVEKEMYTFADRNGDSLTLRPEGTASCVRAAIQHGLLHNQTQRLWYFGPMFRHERPQQGRYRQFYQFGVECFGFTGPDIDAELILMSARFWRALGLDKVELQINSLGSQEARAAYRETLCDYLQDHYEQLDEDSKRRLKTNPLRILDSKNPDMQQINDGAPQLLDYLDDESKEHFSQLQAYLTAHEINFTINPRLVRGLDYYNRTVFEWVSNDLGSQGTICAGGRYDSLVAQLGGKESKACGFALGLERVVSLYQQHAQPVRQADIYLVHAGGQSQTMAMTLAEACRDEFTLHVICHCGEGGFKSQLKRADKSGAKVALILGEDEVAANQCAIKLLRDNNTKATFIRVDENTKQVTLPVTDVMNYLKKNIAWE